MGASLDGQGVAGPEGPCGNYNCVYLQGKNNEIRELKARLAIQAFGK